MSEFSGSPACDLGTDGEFAEKIVGAYEDLVEALVQGVGVGLIGSWMAECVCRDMDRSMWALDHPDQLAARLWAGERLR